jgi:hypothetical protein
MAECLENLEPGSDLYDALNNWLTGQIENNSGVRDAIGGVIDGETLLPMSTDVIIDTCDKDELFAFCLQLVQLLNRLVLDLYEILELASNLAEAVVMVTREASGLTAVIEYIEWLQDTAIEAYEANYDVALENEYACELMCRALINDCQLTWNDVFLYFAEKCGQMSIWQNLSSMLTFAVSGTWIGDQFCHLSLAACTYVLALGGDWTGVTLEDINRIWQSYLNDSNPDWGTLCECQELWRATFDWSVSPCGFIPTYGVYSAGVGFVATYHTDTTPDTVRTLPVLDMGVETYTAVKNTVSVAEYTPGSWEGGGGLWGLSANGRYSPPLATRAQLVESGAVDYTHTETYETETNIRVDARCTRADTNNGSMTIDKFITFGRGEVPAAIIANATELVYL